LAIARANKPLRETLRITGLEDLIGAENFYPSIRAGVQAFRELDNAEVKQNP
jgi:hypothetical protein